MSQATMVEVATKRWATLSTTTPNPSIVLTPSGNRSPVSATEVEIFILDHLFTVLPTPPFTPADKQVVAKRVYQHVWQQSAHPGRAPVAA